ncbi:MAG TPA: division/cell wall cluster transcriptional repressor MraZ [Acidimicrobiia bacterium]|nr:division/cell wall cluster transcriptional repressor MraZ [Acidimicrobiia bacterium]
MFLGEHQHSLDAKGRVILPARFRDQLEGGAVMARALDGCLAVYTLDEFQRVAAKLAAARERGPRERQAARSVFTGAVDFTPDKQGRVAIPTHLREYAGLDREVVVAGGYDHIEIWDAQRFGERDQEGIASIVGGEGIDDFM